MVFFIAGSALFIDHFLGEAKRFHPLVGFGNLATGFENKFNQGQNKVFKGCVAMGILVVPPLLLSIIFLKLLGEYRFVFEIIVVYWAIGLRSLIEHTAPIFDSLSKSDLELARTKVSYIVSRNTDSMTSSKIISSSIESTLENGCDSVMATLFWYLIGGVPMVIAHRLINTLDAMWGYRTERFESFGKSAALADDTLNYIPARLTAISYACLGNFKSALQCWKSQAGLLASPNGGPVMCAGAGSLDIKLGGPTLYNNQLVDKVYFGSDSPPHIQDIQRANSLVQKTALLWLLLIGLINLLQLI